IPNGATITQNFALVKEGSLVGKVTDTQGSPITGATVTLGSMSATTDSTGRYKLTMLLPGVYTVTVSAWGFEKGEGTVTITSDATITRDIALGKAVGGTIAGKVTDVDDGSPITGATVDVRSLSTTTNDAGDYTLANVPAGPEQVTVSHKGYLPEYQVVQLI